MLKRKDITFFITRKYIFLILFFVVLGTPTTEGEVPAQ